MKIRFIRLNKDTNKITLIKWYKLFTKELIAKKHLNFKAKRVDINEMTYGVIKEMTIRKINKVI
jgi:hypothetical protein